MALSLIINGAQAIHWLLVEKKADKQVLRKELARLQTELVKLQYWVKHQGLRAIILRDEMQVKVVRLSGLQNTETPWLPSSALGTPSDVEKTQWYFQRYVAHLPAAGEIVLFDRSWYNRAGVERVMGFVPKNSIKNLCNPAQNLNGCWRSGIVLLKYWFSVSDEEQERRFQARVKDPATRWKLDGYRR